MTRKTGDITETAFSTQVEDLLRLGGWLWLHIKPSIMQSGKWASSMNPEGKGFSDYLIASDPRYRTDHRLFFVELKDRLGKTTPEQDMWRDCIRACGIPWLLWRPADIEEIMEALR